MISNAYKLFKNKVGQANHFLITIFVGLDAVNDGAEKKEEFKTSWNPKNREASVSRSKQYAIKSALAWVIDNLDMYLRLCNKKPKLLNEDECKEFDTTGNSVYKKYNCITSNHSEIDENKKAFVDLMICWRNNMVHFEAHNDLLPRTKKYFKYQADTDEVLMKYHFNVNEMIERFEKDECPSFKEATTMISMTIHFVEQLDSILMKEIDQEKYLDEVLVNYLSEDDKLMHKLFDSKQIVQNNKSTESSDESYSNISKKVKRIKQCLVTLGINYDGLDSKGLKYIDKIANLSFKQVKENLKNYSLID